MSEQIRAKILGSLSEEGLPSDPPAFSHLLAEIHPGDLAQALSGFRPEQLATIFRFLDDMTRAEVLDETDPKSREELLELVDNDVLGQLVEIMPPDEGADLIEALGPEEGDQVLEKVKPSRAEDVRELLKYDPDTAGGIMTPHAAVAPEDANAGEALARLQGHDDLEFINYIYVLDLADRLKGVVSLRQLIRAKQATPIRSLMETDLIAAETSTDQEEIARMVDRYNLQAVPVLEDGIFRGIATIDDVVDVIVDEASEDIYRISGSSDMHPTKVSVAQSFRMRIPWLLIPLFGGLGVALIQSEFAEKFKNELLILMLFTPAVIGMSGGVGLQSSTTVVRGLATGEIDMKRIFPMAMKEIAVGALIALGCGVIAAFSVWGVIHSGLLKSPEAGPWHIALAVTLGLVIGMIMGAVTGTLIPLVCERFGVDPAFVAGPFTTTMNDVVGSSCYIAIALFVLRL